MNDIAPGVQLSPGDFASDQEVRWCPGCGDYSILKAVQRTLSQIGARPETTVCISGIGCASRFPYYLETYGYHTIHGRAPAVSRSAATTWRISCAATSTVRSSSSTTRSTA